MMHGQQNVKLGILKFT